MKNLKTILNSNPWFIYPYISLLTFSIVILLFLEKTDIQLAINRLHNPFFDWVFKYSTTLAEGVSIVLLLILTLIIRYRWTIVFSFALVANSIVVYLLKKLLFSDTERPMVFFSQLSDWHAVNGVHLHTNMSFPSGHTAAAFTMFFSLAICLKNKALGLLFFIASFMVGYSRMYLSQHYLRDVVVGSIIGIIISILSYYFVQNSNKLNQLSWIDKSLSQLLSK
jgi:membrane-associated phospholipid phosphatase